MRTRILVLAGALIFGAIGFAFGQAGLGITGTNSENQNSIFHVGMLRISRDTAITATPSGTVSTSYQLVYGLNRVLTVASGGDSVKLPSCLGGKTVWVINAHASNAINVFPNTSTEVINAGSAGAALSVAAGKSILFACAVDGTWYGNLSASLGYRLIAANDNGSLRRAA